MLAGVRGSNNNNSKSSSVIGQGADGRCAKSDDNTSCERSSLSLSLSLSTVSEIDENGSSTAAKHELQVAQLMPH